MAAKNSDMFSILILHFHSSQNAGDAAQLEAAITDLHKSFPDSKILISANYPQERFFQSLSVDVSPSISSLIRLNEEIRRKQRQLASARASGDTEDAAELEDWLRVQISARDRLREDVKFNRQRSFKRARRTGQRSPKA